MIMMFMLLMFSTLLANIMMFICLILNKKSLYQREKNSPFECGFTQKSSPRLPFSLRFFMITIIFLIFDVEITLIMPTIKSFSMTYMQSWYMMNMVFMLILIIGLLHEWNQGMLEWSN